MFLEVSLGLWFLIRAMVISQWRLSLDTNLTKWLSKCGGSLQKKKKTHTHTHTFYDEWWTQNFNKA